MINDLCFWFKYEIVYFHQGEKMGFFLVTGNRKEWGEVGEMVSLTCRTATGVNGSKKLQTWSKAS
jgi:hypothetical protein